MSRPPTTYFAIFLRVSSNDVPAFCSATYASHSVAAQISPALCTSLFVPNTRNGWPVGSASPSLMWRYDSELIAWFVLYGARRMPKYAASSVNDCVVYTLNGY